MPNHLWEPCRDGTKTIYDAFTHRENRVNNTSVGLEKSNVAVLVEARASGHGKRVHLDSGVAILHLRHLFSQDSVGLAQPRHLALHYGQLLLGGW